MAQPLSTLLTIVLLFGLLTADSGIAVRAEVPVIRMGEDRAVVRRLPAIRRPRHDQPLPAGRETRGTRNILAAWFAEPTKRYGHDPFGTGVHAATLRVATAGRRLFTLRLTDVAVFEDLQPRLWDLDGDGRDEIVVIKSYLKGGAALAIAAVRGNELTIVAETPAIGSPHKWLNPAGIGDFDGDGRRDIALVVMPHLAGRLEIWTPHGNRLVRTHSTGDVSNHAIGSRHLKLSAVADFNGDGVVDLAVPSFDRRALRFLTFRDGRMREIARPILPARAGEDFEVVTRNGRPAVRVGIAGGRSIVIAP